MLPNIQPNQMALAYDLIVNLEPFCNWAKEEGGTNFPHSDEIEFRIIGDRRAFAWKLSKLNGTHVIAYSHTAPAQVHYFVMYMAHEIIHLYQAINGLENKSQHNSDFRARAEEVCAIHGYDYRMFV